MKALAINGSPRKQWNTATLLEEVLDGCRSVGAETDLVHLYDHHYRGCKSCFACKRIGGESYGHCSVRDGITPTLESAAAADILVLGSPFYFHTETGEMRSFMERLLFPYLTYTPEHGSIFPGKLSAALIYTMNITEDQMASLQQDSSVVASEGILRRIFGRCEVLLCHDTYQFSDYSKYLATFWDAEAKAKHRDDVFPLDRKKAFDLGARLAGSLA